MMGKIKKLKHWQKIAILLVIYDILAVTLSYGAALWFRFDLQYQSIPRAYLAAWSRFAPWYAVFCVVVFWYLRLYRSMWRFASYSELTRVILSSAVTTLFHIVGITVIFRRMPIVYYVLGSLLQFGFVLAIRFAYRLVTLLRKKRTEGPEDRIMLIGAGQAGQMILRDVNKAPEINGRVVCVIDDNKNKWDRFMDGVPIAGGRDSILENAEKYKANKIFYAIPSASAEQRRDILNICKETNCEIKVLPGIYQMASGQVTISNLKNVSVEDLLGREPIKANMTEVFDFINGKTVLVTGGGGSIGSEPCRQIAAHHPKQLIIFDVYENNAYDIQLELREK